MDFPVNHMSPPVITSAGAEALGYHVATASATVFQASANTSQRAHYVPFRITAPFLAASMFSVNMTVTGNLDLGIYATGGGRIASTGVTAVSGTDVQNIAFSAPVLLTPGRYYMALWSSAAVQFAAMTGSQNMTARRLQIFGYAIQSSLASGLPATATFATTSGQTVFFLFGIAQPGAI